MNRFNQKIAALHKKCGPLILSYLKYTLHIPAQDAEDLLQDTFVKVASNIDQFRGEGTEKNWVFTIAKNTAFNYFKTRKKLPILSSELKNPVYDEVDEGEEQKEPLENPQELYPTDFENRLDGIMRDMEKTLCIQLCMEKSLAQYERDNPHALCPLLVTLSDLNSPIEEIADIIFRTVLETKKLLKQCRKEMKRYKDYNEYEKKYGQASLCWLIIQLQEMGTAKEIGEIIGKDESAVRTAASRCRKNMKTYFKQCKEEC